MKSLHDKKHLLRLIKDSSLSDAEKRKILGELIAAGEITENDIAEALVDDIENNFDKFAALVQEDGVLRFLWQRFQDRPEMLARALVMARPDIFYAHGLASRFVLKLRADLGPIILPPHRPGDDEDSGMEPMPELAQQVKQDLFRLDRDCRFREMLYFFSRSFAEGRALLESEIERTKDAYHRKVLQAVLEQVDQLLRMEFPGVVHSLNGRPFPALHVRWWIEQVRNVQRCLNIGDTGTYKTSFAALAMRHYGIRRTLVLCAPNARENWRDELQRYFVDSPRLQVIESARDAMRLRDDAEFTIVGYSGLISPGVTEALIAHGFDGVVLDESQYTKGVTSTNPENWTQRAAACQDIIGHLPIAFLAALSATPWENRPEEIAAMAVALRPDLFTGGPAQFLKSGAAKSPRFLRELFADQILEIEQREIADLPTVTPKPWEDLFGAEFIEPNRRHRSIYQFVHDFEPDEGDEEDGLLAAQKVQRLLQAAIHPHLVEPHFDWPSHLASAFGGWQLSSKLAWLKPFVEERIADGKIVIGTGLYADGITRADDPDGETAFLGRLLAEWFGEDRLIIIDGEVSTVARKGRRSPRSELIRRWRTDPQVRILLVSMQACPDSVNLTIPKLPGVSKLWITALSFGWKPWKQFLFRFIREGQGVPVEYRVPILRGTIDEALLRLNREKWRVQRLFRAMAALTDSEWQLLRQSGLKQLGRLLRTSSDHVAQITSMMRGRGEERCKKAYDARDDGRSNAEIFAEHFLKAQESSGSGHISRFLSKEVDELASHGLITDEARRCFDAGCGPCTMARRRGKAWAGIDMNPHMLAVVRDTAPNLVTNSSVGHLSQLPTEWTDRFELVVCSLVLHFSSLEPVKHQEPERLRILRELVRVTNPYGLLWLTWNHGYQTDQTFLSWEEGFRREGFAVVRELSGLVRATEAPSRQPYVFWSLLVTPNGATPLFRDVDVFRFPFELTRRRVVQPRDNEPGPKPDGKPERRIYQQFEVVDVRTRSSITDREAASRAAATEVQRIIAAVGAGKTIGRKLGNLPPDLISNWRVLEQMRAQGIFDT